MALRDFRSVIEGAMLGQLAPLRAFTTTETKPVLQIAPIVVTAIDTHRTAAPVIQPGMCNADSTLIWAVTADGTGYWRRRAVGEQCAGTAPVVQPTVIKEGTCSADGQQIYKYSGGQWTTQNGQPVWQTGTGAWVARTPSDVCYVENRTPGGTSVTETRTLRTLRFQYAQVLTEFLQELQTFNQQLVALLPECSEALELAKSPWTTNLISRGPAGKLGWANDLFHSPADTAAWAKAFDLQDQIKYNPALWQRSMVPGTFGIFGVPFAITERDKAVYQKTFTPSKNQRWLIEYQIVLASNSSDTIDDTTRKLKVNDALTKLNQKGLRYTVNLEGFGLNPDPPLATETLDAYLSRGGYLIDVDRTQGMQPAPLVGKSIARIPNGRLACTTFCKDPSSKLPYCTETINLSGDADNVSTWDVYVNIGPTCTITAKYKEYDPSWFQQAVNVVGTFMGKTLKAICTPGTSTNTYATQATTQASNSPNPYVMAWGKTGGYVLAKCGVVYTPQTPITPVEAQLLTPQAPSAPSAPVTVSTIAPKYQGCVSRFHKSKHTFSVYCPVDWKQSAGLGADVTPAQPPSTIKVAELPVAPPEAPNIGTEDTPLYKKPLFWAIVGGVAVAGVGGGYAVARYRRRR